MIILLIIILLLRLSLFLIFFQISIVIFRLFIIFSILVILVPLAIEIFIYLVYIFLMSILFKINRSHFTTILLNILVLLSFAIRPLLFHPHTIINQLINQLFPLIHLLVPFVLLITLHQNRIIPYIIYFKWSNLFISIFISLTLIFILFI